MNAKKTACKFPIQTLSEEQVKDIHAASCQVLEETGMIIHHEEALELLEKAGAKVSGNKVYIPKEMVENAIKTAPDKIVLYDRDGNEAIDLSGSNVSFGVGSDTLKILEPLTGEKRKWLQEDVKRGIVVCDYLENIDFTMSLGLLSDVPRKMINREQYAIMLKNSKKPQVVVTEDKDALEDMLDMAASVIGGREAFKEKPLFMLYTEPTSPLQHPYDSVDKLLFSAQHGIPTNFASGGVAGATTPVTVAGALVLENAECLTGLVMHQLKNPGAPFVYGYGNSPLDMRTMQAVYSTPEAIQIQGGLCDLAKHYGLPTWGYAGCNNSKTLDAQAVMESTMFTVMGALQGCNIMHDVYYMEFGTTGCLELIVICDEIINRVKSMIGEVDTSPDKLAVDAIARVGAGGDFLGDPHTATNFRSSWQTNLSDFTGDETWVQNGSQTMLQRAHEKVNWILENHQPEKLPEEAERKINEIMKKATERLGD